MLKLNLHPLNYLLILILGIVAIFTASSMAQYIVIDVLLLVIISIYSKIKLKTIMIFTIFLIPALFSYYLSTYIFGVAKDEVFLLIIRLASLSLISFIYVIHIPHEKLMNEIMQRKFLPIPISFAIIATFNAFIYLKNEYSKIQLAYKMRFGKISISPKLILPLMVSAARYAHHLSISMYSRGLNEKRSFYQIKTPYNLFDLMIIISISLLLMIIHNHIL